MNDNSLSSSADIRAFLSGARKIDLQVPTEQQYSWLAKTLKQTGYFKLRKKDKSSVQEYLLKMTGYSRQHLTKLIGQYRKNKWIGKKYPKRNRFNKVYTREDILLLATTDEQHDKLSGVITKKLFERAFMVYGDPAYARLSKISISHVYNLRRSTTYRCKRFVFNNTPPTSVKIGERRKPYPNNQPGYLRIDTVHQGDKDGEKGVYHINAVTTNNFKDSEILPDLLDQIDSDLSQVTGDSGYDIHENYRLIANSGADPVLLPKEDVVIAQHGNCHLPIKPRDGVIRKIRQLGRKNWKKQSGYHRRSLIETAIYRLKTIFDGVLRARLFENQGTEILLRCFALNKMTQLGMPISYAVV